MLDFIITNAATIATLVFFIVFLYVTFFAFRKKNKEKFNDFAKIPLKD